MNFLLILVAIAVSPWLLRLFLWGCRGGRLVELIDPLPAKAAPQVADISRDFRIVWNGDHYHVEQRARDWIGRLWESWIPLLIWWEWDQSSPSYKARPTGKITRFSMQAGTHANPSDFIDYETAEKSLRLVVEQAGRRERYKSKDWRGVTSEQRPQKEDEQ